MSRYDTSSDSSLFAHICCTLFAYTGFELSPAATAPRPWNVRRNWRNRRLISSPTVSFEIHSVSGTL